MTKTEYLQRANECERLANRVLSEEHRQHLLNIATAWRKLAKPSKPKRGVTPRAA